MSQYRRLGKNLETPRPLNASGGVTTIQPKNHYEINGIEELITLIENVATTLVNGSINAENLNMLTYNLRIHGPRLEEIAKDTLDRTFVVLRNSSQDERLSIMTRLNLLELIELRAKHWQISKDINSYYHQSKANNTVEQDGFQPTTLSTSPPLQIVPTPALTPGEVIRNSGKFTKPTKIPGKNYSKDEIVIRNADSGKVMGIKGRRVHMIEELSETIISFQKVNPGAKERLVQITGPSEEKINYAKSLIEDTIRRNASPVRLDSQDDTGVVLPSGNGALMQPPVVQSQAINIGQSPMFMPQQGGGSSSVSKFRNSFGSGPQHSYSTDDASLGEYKYTVNVGQRSIKITGDNFELIRTAKLVLDDYFSSAEFLQSIGELDDYNHPYHHGGIMVQDSFVVGDQMHGNVMRDDSGIALDKKSPGKVNDEMSENTETKKAVIKTVRSAEIHSKDEIEDDEVFIVDENGKEIPVVSKSESGVSLARSKKCNNLLYTKAPSIQKRFIYDINELLEFSNSPFAWSLPHNWIKICEKLPTLVRNKDLTNEKNRFTVQKYLEFRSQTTSDEKTPLEPSNSSSSILDDSTDPDNDSVIEKLSGCSNLIQQTPDQDDEVERNL